MRRNPARVALGFWATSPDAERRSKFPVAQSVLRRTPGSRDSISSQDRGKGRGGTRREGSREGQNEDNLPTNIARRGKAKRFFTLRMSLSAPASDVLDRKPEGNVLPQEFGDRCGGSHVFRGSPLNSSSSCLTRSVRGAATWGMSAGFIDDLLHLRGQPWQSLLLRSISTQSIEAHTGGIVGLRG